MKFGSFREPPASVRVLLLVHLVFCSGFALLWHWTAPGRLPDLWSTMRMGVLLAVVFCFYPSWIWRLRCRAERP